MLGAVVAGVGCSRSSDGAATSSARHEAASSSATPQTFCGSLFDGVLRRLEAGCSNDDQKDKRFAYLRDLVRTRRDDCLAAAQVIRDSAAGVLDGAAARRCGAALANASYKDALDRRDISLLFPACRGLVEGKLAESAKCANGLECADGLPCRKDPDGSGRCERPNAAGQSCTIDRPTFGGDAHPPCQPSLACVGGLPAADAHPLGASQAALLPRELAELEPRGVELFGLSPARAAAVGVGFDDPLLASPEELGAVGAGLVAPPSGRAPAPPAAGGGGRGDPKAPSVRLAPPAVNGALTMAAVTRVLESKLPVARKCYADALKDDSFLAGRLTVDFEIASAGGVVKLSTRGELAAGALGGCFTEAFAKLPFPRTDSHADAKATFTFLLAPPRAPGPAPGGSSSPAPPPGPATSAGAGSSCMPTPAPAEKGAPCGLAGCMPGLYCDPGDGAGGTCRERKPAGDVCTASVECQGRCDLVTLACVDFCVAK